jgi:hypothetical protein
VGIAGLAVAFIGGVIGPVAILVQGQAWRWVWITVFTGIVLVPFTALQVSRDKKCGPFCALLLVSAWTLPGIAGTPCLMLALVAWLSRERIGTRLATCLRFITAALGAAMVVWILTKCWPIALPATGRLQSGTVQLQDMLWLKVPAVLLSVLVWWGTRANRATWTPIFLLATLSAISAFFLPVGFKQSQTLAAAADIDEFVDWEHAIPSSCTVLVVPPRDVGAFVWFTLNRPNYLTVDQSSGVVFSRATALEVRRRSEVLSPLMQPNWKILSGLRASPGVEHKKEDGTSPLTLRKLVQVCEDPQLGFVISPEKVGFESLRHEHAGTWKDWNLYDCRKVRSVPPGT